jgi:hypothetical protein
LTKILKFTVDAPIFGAGDPVLPTKEDTFVDTEL